MQIVAVAVIPTVHDYGYHRRRRDLKYSMIIKRKTRRNSLATVHGVRRRRYGTEGWQSRIGAPTCQEVNRASKAQRSALVLSRSLDSCPFAATALRDDRVGIGEETEMAGRFACRALLGPSK